MRKSVLLSGLLGVVVLSRASMLAQVVQSFSEDTIRHSLSLPAGVIHLLLRDKDVRDVLEGEHLPITTVPTDWYEAAPIQVGPDGTESIVVVGHGPIGGAHALWFWVCSKENGPWVLSLRATGDVLDVMTHKNGGWRDMKTSYFTYSTVYEYRYRWLGLHYRQLKYAEIARKN